MRREGEPTFLLLPTLRELKNAWNRMADNSDYDTWRLAADLVLETYKITAPSFEREFQGIATQIRGVAVGLLCSVSDEIGRRARNEPVGLSGTKMSSLAEMEALLTLFEETGLITDAGRVRDLVESLRVKLWTREPLSRPGHGIEK